jgi:putative DeoR family transcriptional regulator, stage III sporulation protein D
MKHEEIRNRAIKHGLLFIKRGYTIRKVANETGFSKATVHLDLRRLQRINPDLYKKIEEKIIFHLTSRHIRGGESTKKKWERKKK